jgi:hypothetical protein
VPLNDATLQRLSIHVQPDSFRIIRRCRFVSLNRGVRRPSSREGTHALACSSIKNKALPLAGSSGPASWGDVEWSVQEQAIYRYYSCSMLERSVSVCPVRFVIYQRCIFPVRRLYIVICHGKMKEIIAVLLCSG